MSERKRVNEPANRIQQELVDAVSAGKAPKFEVLGFDFHSRLWKMGAGGKQRVEKRLGVSLSLLLDNEPVVHAKEQTVRQLRKGFAYEGRMGSVDIMETALREAIVLCWPEIGPELAKVKTTSYAVHAVGASQGVSQEEYHVQIHLRVVIEGCDEPYAVSLEGVDSIGLTFEALVIIYHWFVWRTFRRWRGEARRSGKR